MKIMHLADLHIGKRVNEFSMIDDQKYILDEIVKIAEEKDIDSVIIAGDVYDKSVPSAEAVELFDDFLVKLSRLSLNVLVISGNHDSPERIAFGGRIMEESRVYMSPVYDGELKKITLRDKYGNINFYMLPFVKPVNVKRFFPEEDIESYTDAVRTAVSSANIDESERNIIITHQFVTGSEKCESEEISVGGTDNVDASCFEKFDYVALGHLHRPQKCGRETIRYCGTPLKYSFSEARDIKSVTILNMEEKGEINIETVPLKPLHDMKEIRGKFEDISSSTFYTDDYVRVVLTDEDDVLDALGKLRVVYPNIMRLEYDNKRTRENNIINKASDVKSKSPFQLFEEFFELQNNQPMTDDQAKYIKELIEEMWGVR